MGKCSCICVSTSMCAQVCLHACDCLKHAVGSGLPENAALERINAWGCTYEILHAQAYRMCAHLHLLISLGVQPVGCLGGEDGEKVKKRRVLWGYTDGLNPGKQELGQMDYGLWDRVCIVRWGPPSPQNIHPPQPHLPAGLHPTISWASASPRSPCSTPTRCA